VVQRQSTTQFVQGFFFFFFWSFNYTIRVTLRETRESE
jgi:hypothetical protein